MAKTPSPKSPRKAAAKPTSTLQPLAPVAEAPVVEAVAPIAGAVPVAAASVLESVVETISDIRDAVSPASLQAKGKTMNDTVKNMTADMTKQGEKITAELKTRAEDALAKGQKYVAELNEFNKGNIEALIESGKIAAKGFEKLGQDSADYARKSFEQTTTAFKGMASVKSPTELVKLHSDYVRTSFDAWIAEASRSTEAALKLAGEVAQPISNRFAVAAEKVKLAA